MGYIIIITMFIINHLTGAVSEGAARASNYSGLVDKLQCPNRQNKCPRGQSSMPYDKITSQRGHLN